MQDIASEDAESFRRKELAFLNRPENRRDAASAQIPIREARPPTTIVSIETAVMTIAHAVLKGEGKAHPAPPAAITRNPRLDDATQIGVKGTIDVAVH